MATSRRIRIDDDLATEIAQQGEMRQNSFPLILDLPVEDAAIEPARDELESETVQDGRQGARGPRKLAAKFRARIACFGCLLKTGLQRSIPPQLRNIVIRPGD